MQTKQYHATSPHHAIRQQLVVLHLQPEFGGNFRGRKRARQHVKHAALARNTLKRMRHQIHTALRIQGVYQPQQRVDAHDVGHARVGARLVDEAGSVGEEYARVLAGKMSEAILELWKRNGRFVDIEHRELVQGLRVTLRVTRRHARVQRGCVSWMQGIEAAR